MDARSAWRFQVLQALHRAFCKHEGSEASTGEVFNGEGRAKQRRFSVEQQRRILAE